jgi:hypothetical protein
MGYKALTIEGLNVAFHNIPGSGITRVSIDGTDVFGFDPKAEAFVNFPGGKAVVVQPDLPAVQVRALRRALVQHSIERELEFERMDREARRRCGGC